MKIITFCSIKGGVGKTSALTLSARCVAEYLSETQRGKVLVIDLDANRSATMALLSFKKIKEIDQQGKHAASAFFRMTGLQNFVTKSIFQNLYIVAGHGQITEIQISQLMLRNLINESDLSEYEYIFIDLPATYYGLHTMALTVADKIITPVNLDYYNLEATIQLKRKLEQDFGRDILSKWTIFTNRQKKRQSIDDEEYFENFRNVKYPDGSFMFKDNFSDVTLFETVLTRRCADQKYYVSRNRMFEGFHDVICKLASEVTGEEIRPQELF